MPVTDKHRFSQLVDTVVSMHQQPSTASLFSSASTSGHPASTSRSSVADAWMTLNSPLPMPLPTSVPASFSSASTMADVNEAMISATGVMQHNDDMDRRGFLPTPLTYLSSVPASPFVLAMNPSPPTSLAPSLQPAFSTPPPQQVIEPADYTFELIFVADEWTRLPMPPS
ncbi:hypothetical protein DM01DRAFT_1376393 [Hesseltinella vesiculosa]|uniref:Uncharacterized protein n=1 Tax=Hesseltinella vesiculosa TaxID=101127 RepID=A0A1X2GB59_9FUNG|nr:hypothetical protein DM01DRAFT_1376393 [Hesseltinella vesiculosa]